MRTRHVDALVIQNSSDWVGGYIRWFSNEPATNGYLSALVFPSDGGSRRTNVWYMVHTPYAEADLRGVGR